MRKGALRKAENIRDTHFRTSSFISHPAPSPESRKIKCSRPSGKCVSLRGIFDDKRSYVSRRTKISKSKEKEAPITLSFDIGDEAYTR